jgi:hypothetical protein
MKLSDSVSIHAIGNEIRSRASAPASDSPKLRINESRRAGRGGGSDSEESLLPSPRARRL